LRRRRENAEKDEEEKGKEDEDAAASASPSPLARSRTEYRRSEAIRPLTPICVVSNSLAIYLNPPGSA
jgi:hypothetical protein